MEQKVANCGKSLTRIVFREVNYTWTIENFSLCNASVGKMMRSKKFPKLDGDQCEWNLRLYPGGDEEESKKFVSLYVESMSIQDDIIANYKLVLKSNNGKILKNFEAYSTLFSNESYKAWGCKKLIDRVSIISFLQDDVLIIDCWIKWATDVSEEPKVSEELVMNRPSMQDRLICNYEKLLEESSFSDVTLVTNDGTKFSAHKCILAICSPVFAAMFSSDMKEVEESSVKIKDISSNTLQTMLYFMYTYKLDKEVCEINQLLTAADKYAFEDLKLLCEQKIIKNLKVENVAKCLLLADRHNAEDLKKQSLALISKNLKDVLETEEMKSILSIDPTLFYDTMKAVAN